MSNTVKHIIVHEVPSNYVLRDGEFVCPHSDTYADSIEHYDEYTHAVTGIPQALSVEMIDVCKQCEAYKSEWDGEWHDER